MQISYKLQLLVSDIINASYYPPSKIQYDIAC